VLRFEAIGIKVMHFELKNKGITELIPGSVDRKESTA